MKALRVFPCFLAALALTTFSAPAQTAGNDAPNDLPASIASARCAYTPSDTTCTVGSSQPEQDLGANKTISNPTVAQRSRGMPGPPASRGPMVYPGPYSSVRAGSGRQVAIGAAIGFGLGAAIGAKAGWHQSSATTIKVSVLFGAIGAAMGGAIGGRPSFRSGGWSGSRPHRGHRKKFEDEKMASHTKAIEPGPPQPKPASGQ
jgi:hypothetical protein